MKQVSRWETSDGKLHETYLEAKHHAENRYGLQLSAMAHELLRVEKYAEMLDKLDGFKGAMRLLLDLNEDLKIEEEDE